MVSVHGASGDEPDKFDYAGGYLLESVTLYPHNQSKENLDDGIDIKRIINHVHIEESVYSFGLICTIQVADGINLMEEYRLTGSERLRVVIRRKDPFQELTRVEMDFVASEYPLYVRGSNKKVQAYEIVFVSDHIFKNNLLTVSKSMSGSPVDMIRNIMTTNLSYPEDKIEVDTNVNNNFKYIVPSVRPLKAIRDISRNTVDTSLAPIYSWETMTKFNIKGLTEILSQEPYKGRTYYLKAGTNINRHNDKDKMFVDQLTTILELSSNLPMSKLKESMDGTYGSTTNHYDIATKSFKTSVYNYNVGKDDVLKLSKYHTMSDTFTFDDKPLSDYHTAREYNLTTTSESYNGKHLGETNPVHVGVRESILSHQEFITHNIKLYGDLDFSSGSIVNLHIPSGDINSKDKDTHFSGKYMVTGVTHKFGKDYTMDVTIKKDGIEEDINQV